MSEVDPRIDPEDLPYLREHIEGIRAKPDQFLLLRGITLQLIDDLTTAYDRLGVMYERFDKVTIPNLAGERHD